MIQHTVSKSIQSLVCSCWCGGATLHVAVWQVFGLAECRGRHVVTPSDLSSVARNKAWNRSKRAETAPALLALAAQPMSGQSGLAVSTHGSIRSL